MNNSFLSRWFGRNSNDMQTVRYLSNSGGDIFDRYSKLYSLYINNDAYNAIVRGAVLAGVKMESIKALRTPVNRSVEWFTSKLLTNATVQTNNESLKEAIERFWKWSNFEQKKRTYSRLFSLYGDFFAKVVGDDDKVYMQEIKPKHVTDFTTDARGFLTSIRIDIPIEDDNGMSMMFTEYWTTLEPNPYYAIWEHRQDRNADLDNLGTPKDSAFLSELGIDFVPIVYAPFVDFEGTRGLGCTAHALDKIDEINRMATRLHQLLFIYNKPYNAALSSGLDGNNRPIPKKIKAINLNGNDTNTDTTTQDMYADVDRTILDLTGYASIEDLIPNINFADALAILKAQEEDIEKDLPELKSFAMEGSDLAGAGKALRIILANAITRGNDARGNIVQALTRANQMALTIGIFNGIFDATLGTFDTGDFEHEIVCDEIFGMDANEKITFVQMATASGMALATAMRLAGYSEIEVQKAMQEKDEQDTKANANLVGSILSNRSFTSDANANA